MDSEDGTARRRTQCCIAGGGPAGVMLGYLLARAGVEVTVLEKHGDFLRDFRGDTIHPSTLELMAELGVLSDFLDRPHTEVHRLRMVVDGTSMAPVDFSTLPTTCRFIALMPQWDFLNFIVERASAYPNFRLEMNTEVTGLLREGDRVTGVRARRADGEDVEITADLTVAADGWHSVLRAAAMLPSREFGVPIDVLWFRLPKKHGADDVPVDSGPDAGPDSDAGPDPEAGPDADPAVDSAAEPDAEPALGHVRDGRMVLTIDRGDYWQTGVLIEKGGFERIKAEGLDAFRDGVVSVAPFLGSAASELAGFDDVSLLSVQVNRLRRWHRPGLLFIGDAAHAMSPAFGVGVNYAVQDAVATANALALRLRHGLVTEADLHRVQRRREVPVIAMQAIQVALHRYVLGTTRSVRRVSPDSVPGPLRSLGGAVAPFGRRGVGRVIGLGFLPEHIHSPEAADSAR